MRAFLAVVLTDELKKEIESCCGALKKQKAGARIRWVMIDNIHLTLRFLGKTQAEIIDDMVLSIKEKIKTIKPFTIEFTHIDFFPARHPHVVALFIKPCESLITLNDLLEQIALQHHFQAEDRPFLPHVTVGRMRQFRPPPLDFSDCDMHASMLVDRLVLFESLLGSNGSEYRALQEFKLHPI